MILNIIRLILSAFVIVMIINYTKDESYTRWGPAVTAIVTKIGLIALSLLNVITIDF